MVDYIIRNIKTSEIPLLSTFIYEAIFKKNEDAPLPTDIINEPDVKVYIEGFGKKDDYCLVAEKDKKIIGAVWARILCGEIKGFGNIDEQTPEFAISLFKEYRNKGIGTALMKRMLQLLKENGYRQTSLAVQKENYAANMYKKLGFKVVKETDEQFIMLFSLEEKK